MTFSGLSFIKKHRISSKSDFLALFSDGTRKSCKNLRVSYLPDERLRWAFSVSKKVGNAVFRNKVRRILRETLRLNELNFKRPVKCIIQVFPFKENEISELSSSLEKALKKAELL
jgi:ribonuclease P protein component